MGRLYIRQMEEENIYHCLGCSTHLSSSDQVISKSFHGRSGRAFLMNEVINSYCGPPERRVLMTGLHTVADIYCIKCHALLGWKYEEAFEESEKYKIGKFILEKARIGKLNW